MMRFFSKATSSPTVAIGLSIAIQAGIQVAFAKATNKSKKEDTSSEKKSLPPSATSDSQLDKQQTPATTTPKIGRRS